MMSAALLEHAILDTVRYFSLLGLPVTATMIWRYLIVARVPSRLRWSGQRRFTLMEVRAALAHSTALTERLATRWGYWFWRGDAGLVEEHLQRHRIAQAKWRLTRRAARWLTLVPFVRMLAGSGSLAMYHTHARSDLDVFVVVRAGRIWTARLLLLVVAQLLGRRRRYWDREAPDKVCLNHYVTDRQLVVPPAVRNVYTAVAYLHLVPLYGAAVGWAFMAENGAWMRGMVMYQDPLPLPSVHAVRVGWGITVKRLLESVLREPVGAAFERWAERVQRAAVAAHARPGQAGRVALSAVELAFHPDTRVPAILKAFAQEEGQRMLW